MAFIYFFKRIFIYLVLLAVLGLAPFMLTMVTSKNRAGADSGPENT